MIPYKGLCRILGLCSIYCSLSIALPVQAAMDPRFELDSKALGVVETPKKKLAAGKPGANRTAKSKASEALTTDGTVHIVKPGDNLFRILVRNYAFSSDEAEAFIDVICRENNISDIQKLKVGKKIFIPSSWHTAEKTNRNHKVLQANTAIQGTKGMALRLEPPDSVLSEREANAQVKKSWDKILPPLPNQQKPDMISSPKYSLSLDPQRFPIFSAMDGGRILVDRNDSIPPLVKALISEKNPNVKIVAESPVNGKRFLSAMLDSAGFYSVEEDFSMDFGTDPKLTVYSDFKIEKSPDSLINQDMILMNSGRTSNPRALNDFLKKEGFTVHEPYASYRPAVAAPSGRLFQITSHNQSEIVDSLLASMAISPDRNKSIDVFAADNNGISLSVKADRYFERDGQRHIIARYDGDPVTYTLYRILEAKGYQTVILEDKDDFRKVTEKLLSRMRIQGTYDRHKLGPDTGQNYSLQMSGFRLEGPGLPAPDIFVTNLDLDRLTRDLLLESGYRIIAK